MFMVNKQKNKKIRANLRAKRVRARISGTSVSPRLSVKRSLRHIYGQIIDDTIGRTLVSASDHDVKEKIDSRLVLAQEVGKILALRAKEKGITHVVFDRGSYRYHGRIAALADGVRQEGIVL